MILLNVFTGAKLLQIFWLRCKMKSWALLFLYARSIIERERKFLFFIAVFLLFPNFFSSFRYKKNFFFSSSIQSTHTKFFIARFPELTFRNVCMCTWQLIITVQNEILIKTPIAWKHASLSLNFLKKSWRETPEKWKQECLRDRHMHRYTYQGCHAWERKLYTRDFLKRNDFFFSFLTFFSVTKRIAIENHTWNHEHARTRTLLVPSGYSWLTINWFYSSFIIVHTK